MAEDEEVWFIGEVVIAVAGSKYCDSMELIVSMITDGKVDGRV